MKDVPRETVQYIQNSFKEYTKRMDGNFAIPIIQDEIRKKFKININIKVVYLFANYGYDKAFIEIKKERREKAKKYYRDHCGKQRENYRISLQEKNPSFDEFNHSIKELENGHVPVLKHDNNYVKVLLVLEEFDRDVSGKKLSNVLGFDVKRYLSILSSRGMTEHTSRIKQTISKRGKDYLKLMQISTR